MGHYNKIQYANYYRVITTTYANYCAVDLITLPNLYIQYVNFLSGTKPAKIQDFCGRALTSGKLQWPTRDTLSPCKSIAAPWKLTCSVHFRLFSVQTIAAPCKIGCSIQTYEAFPYKNGASPWKIRSFSLENSMLLRTNRMLLRGKFDISPYKSKASALKIRCFSVQIESFPVQNSMLLRTNRKRSKASPSKTTQ